MEYNCENCHDTGNDVEGNICTECCPHEEHDHFICLDCGHEGEPSDYYNEDEGLER